MDTEKQAEKVVLDREYLENLEKEDKYLGDLMEKEEKKENISLSDVITKKLMND